MNTIYFRQSRETTAAGVIERDNAAATADASHGGSVYLRNSVPFFLPERGKLLSALELEKTKLLWCTKVLQRAGRRVADG